MTEFTLTNNQSSFEARPTIGINVDELNTRLPRFRAAFKAAKSAEDSVDRVAFFTADHLSVLDTDEEGIWSFDPYEFGIDDTTLYFVVEDINGAHAEYALDLTEYVPR